MESAFGVEHGDVSKGLKPRNVQALKRVAYGQSKASSGRGASYAYSKLNLMETGRPGPGNVHRHFPFYKPAESKGQMSQAIRTSKNKKRVLP